MDKIMEQIEEKQKSLTVPGTNPDFPLSFLTKCTDSATGEMINHLYGDRLRYDHKQGRWLIWKEHWWETDKQNERRLFALDIARERYWAAERCINDYQEKLRIAKYALRSEDKSKIDAALDMAACFKPISDSGDGWDSDPYLLGVGNGIVDLRTGELMDGTPDQKISIHTDITYDPGKPCYRFERFLAEILSNDEDLIEYVNRSLAYSLTGLTKEQIFFVLQGSGSNGKGVLTEIMRYVMGDNAYDSGFEAFSDKDSHPESLASLAGKRFVTAAEVKETVKLNEQRLKALSHGDTVSARHMHKNRFEFHPQCKIWLSLNKKPRISDNSFGFWRSVRTIKFERQFTNDKDNGLIDKLKNEASGILSHLIFYAKQYFEEGLGECASVMTETDEWQKESDPLQEFFETRTVEIDGYTPASDMWREYIKYAEENGIPERQRVSNRFFGLRLGERYKKEIVRFNGKPQRVYHGIGLLDESHE